MDTSQAGKAICKPVMETSVGMTWFCCSCGMLNSGADWKCGDFYCRHSRCDVTRPTSWAVVLEGKL